MYIDLDLNQLNVAKNKSLKFCFFSSFPHRYDYCFPVGGTESWIAFAANSDFDSIEEFATHVIALPFLKFHDYDKKGLDVLKNYKLQNRTPEEIIFLTNGIFDTYRDFTESYFLKIEIVLDRSSIINAVSLVTSNSGTAIFFQSLDFYIAVLGE